MCWHADLDGTQPNVAHYPPKLKVGKQVVNLCPIISMNMMPAADTLRWITKNQAEATRLQGCIQEGDGG